ncbi:copper amine oxidase [Arthrobacter sp. NPDC090010]|uniref:copper amine oxidase n=1 Tax=Arthrobacter sp. NPDC090010 TaxID=3363942 RepID=UPI00381CC5BB
MTRRSRTLITIAIAAVLFLGGWAVGGLASPGTSAGTPQAASPSSSGLTSNGDAGADCGEGEKGLTHAFPSGSSWRMCWHIDPQQGLTLSRVAYTAPGKAEVKVIEEMSLSQLEVPYDSGARVTKDITEHGFGGRSMKTLGPAECAGRRLSATIPDFGNGAVGGSETREVLCSQEVDAGLARRSDYYQEAPVAQRGRAFELSTLSVVGWYEYLSLYSFGEDGSISPRLGATGDLSPEDYTRDPKLGSPVGPGNGEGATSHSHNAVWRIHWGLSGPQTVREYNADFTGKRGAASAIVEGSFTPLGTETERLRQDRRWWQVLGAQANPDGHQMSYRIQLDQSDGYTPHSHGDHAGQGGPGEGDAGFGYDVAFTQYKDCERFATQNLSTGCPSSGVPQFVNSEKLSDVVSWVVVSYHHVPRDEDQSPMDMHWQGFSLQPRDLFSQNPLAPSDRATLNGRPATR